MKKQLSFIDLFAGAGGFELGVTMSGFQPILSVEKDSFACDTLLKNFNHRILCEDVLKINDRQIINLLEDKPDLIIGGPPCQGFSVAASNRININDSRNSMPLVFLNWVKILRPKAFIIENVPGILSKKNQSNKLILDDILEYSKFLGYEISIWKLNALNYGVPQQRNRVFLVGLPHGNIIPPPKATHTEFLTEENIKSNFLQAITVNNAISDLPYIEASQGEEVTNYTTPPENEYQVWARADSIRVHNHVAMKHTDRMIKRYQAYKEGVIELPDELAVRQRNGNGKLSNSRFNLNYRYLSPDKASYTIPASFYSSFIHPSIPRNITTREAARLQSFPDTYIFKGKRTLISEKLLKRQGKESEIGLSQYNQVGNAVPPLLAKVIGEHLMDFLLI